MPTSGWDNVYGTRNQTASPWGWGDFLVEMDRRHSRVQGSRTIGNNRQFQNRVVFPSEMAEIWAAGHTASVATPSLCHGSTAAATGINKPIHGQCANEAL